MTSQDATCSFCAKPESQVKQLIRGPHARICNECIELSARLLTDPSSDGRPEAILKAVRLGEADSPTSLPPSDSVDVYLRSVRQHPPLAEATRRELLVLARQGNEQAFRQLVEGQLELVALLALSACPSSILPLDAIQEANIFLVNLIKDGTVADPTLALAAGLRTALEEKATTVTK